MTRGSLPDTELMEIEQRLTPVIPLQEKALVIYIERLAFDLDQESRLESIQVHQYLRHHSKRLWRLLTGRKAKLSGHETQGHCWVPALISGGSKIKINLVG